MLRSFIAFLILITVYSTCNAQTFDKWKSGSAVELKGKIYILSIFITTPKNKWTYDDKINLTARQLEAQDWLIKEAKEYGTDISFENGFYGVKTDIVVNEITDIDQPIDRRNDWVNFLLTQIGYNSPLEFLERLKITKDCQNAIVVIYANEKGRSYAVPYCTDYNKKKYFFEGCMVYRSYKGEPLHASTIAHEILHLFGAWDLYKRNKEDKKRAHKAWELYPKDIMFISPVDINDAKIDKLTAWLVGLYKYKKDEFEWFRPSNRPNE